MKLEKPFVKVTRDWSVGQMAGMCRCEWFFSQQICILSLTLHVGKEVFDVSKANIQSEHNHLFVRHQKSMQAQAVFRTKLSFRYGRCISRLKAHSLPCFRQHSNDSLAHLKLKFASKANPAPKVRVLSNIKAPLLNSVDMMKVNRSILLVFIFVCL